MPEPLPDLTGLGRFAEPSLLILASLAGGPKHGYAMMEDIARMSGVRLGPGTLYGALARLEQRRLIEPLAAEDRRRPYRLTGAGAAALGEQLRGLASFATTGLERLATS
jgi:DNA-binding PadR family transcriptional regulator